jgi:hypothetical protein
MTSPLSPQPLEFEDVTPILDFSNETLRRLAERLEASSTFQACVAREVELDEIWRRVDTALHAAREEDADPDRIAMLEGLFELVFEAHDLAGDDRPREAAARLRQAMTLQ